MRSPIRCAARSVLCLAILVATSVRAENDAVPHATVEAVQMPAWLERGAAKIPVEPGMELKNGDQLRTGADARLLLRTADGSAVKLGANARLRLSGMAQQRDGVFAAALNVATGAFRFTTGILGTLRGRRAVNITVGTVTTGIRGTDLWGSSTHNREVVCLIEGRIEVKPSGESPIALNEPLQFYVRENGRSKPVARVNPDQLKQWAAETEIASGAGGARRGGEWNVVLSTTANRDQALRLRAEAREAGYAADIAIIDADGKRAYRVQLEQLPSMEEARALAGRLKGRFGAGVPEVSM